MPTMRKKSCLEEGNHSNAVINSTRQTDNNNHEGNNGRVKNKLIYYLRVHLYLLERIQIY